MSATLSLHDLTVSRGARTILDSVDLLVAPGDRVGVVGPNGVGKSTLLAAAAGELSPDAGEVRLAPPSANVGWLRQEPDRSGETVRDLLRRRTGVTAAQLELDTATALLVDEMVSKQEVVIKNLGSFMQGLPGVAGGAILGDGNIALILDPASILQAA